MIKHLQLLTIVVLLGCATATCAAPVGTAFTYQGKLTDSAGAPLSGSYDLTFKLFDAETGGSRIGSIITKSGVAVSSGLFSVELDFGAAAFDGSARWLETTVGTETLAPRAEIASTPNAIYAQRAPWSGIVGAPSSLPPSGNAGGSLDGTYPNPTLANGSVGSAQIVNGAVGHADLAGDEEALAKVSGGVITSTGGSIGVGTTSPTQKLSLYDGNLCLQTPDNLLDQSILFQNSGGAYTWRIYRTDAGNNKADLRIAGAGADSDFTALSDVLTLTSKGNVGIGTTDPAVQLDVNGKAQISGLVTSANQGISVGTDYTQGAPFQVYAPTYAVDQQNLDFAGSAYTSGTLWQSFTAGVNGELVAVRLYCGLYGGGRWSGTLKIFSGEGTDGDRLTSQTIVADGFADRVFTLENPLAITSGSKYTVAIVPNGYVVDWKRKLEDVYAGGRFAASANHDAYFVTYVATDDATPAIVVQPNTGNVGIGTDSPNYKLHVNGSVAGVGAYNQLSDIRYKTDIREIPDALDKVEALRGVTFDWKRGEYPNINFNDAKQAGVIAQEVQKVLPEAVTRGSDGTLSVSYGSLVPLLIEAVKEQQRTIQNQQETVDRVLAELAALKSRIDNK